MVKGLAAGMEWLFVPYAIDYKWLNIDRDRDSPREVFSRAPRNLLNLRLFV